MGRATGLRYPRLVPQIRAAQIVVFYLFDVAESIDLSAVPALVGGAAAPAKLEPKPLTPPYIQYEKPPLVFDGDVLGLGTVDGFQARFRAYDYGVLTVALTQPMTGSWASIVDLTQQLVENDELELRAEQLVTRVVDRLRPALVDHRDTHLREDYLVILVHELDAPLTAEELVASHGADIAAMVRGERHALSPQEQESVLRHRISYLRDDLVIPTWNAAFIYDTPTGAQAALEILEFANSQLLQFRYYDERLDHEMSAIYARVQRPRWVDQWIGSRHTRAARQMHALFIDVTEIVDRTVNALKFTGDIYAARLFGLVAGRLGLDTWKGNVERKLNTLNDIYRFAVEQSSMARGQGLELAIVLILIFELVLFFMGIMK